MPDQATLTPPAESSPAAPAAENGTVILPRDPDAYAHFRVYGELPESKPETESAPEKQDHPAPKGEKAPPASEPGKPRQDKPKNRDAEYRLNELLADLKTAGLTPAELKTFKREAARAAEPAPPKSEQTAKPVERKAPQRPDTENWTGTWAELQDAQSKYFEDLAEWKATEAVQKDRDQRYRESQEREMLTKVTEAEKRYGADASAVIQQTAQRLVEKDNGIPVAIQQLIWESPVIADLVYVMGSNPADLAEFIQTARTNPTRAVRKLVLLENLVEEELKRGSLPAAGQTGRDETGKFTAAAPAKPKASQAPPPPDELDGRGSRPVDETDRAFQSNDFARFRDAENRKDLARMKHR